MIPLNDLLLLASALVNVILGAGLMASVKTKKAGEVKPLRTSEQRRDQTLGLLLCLSSLIIFLLISPSVALAIFVWVLALMTGMRFFVSPPLLKRMSYILVLLVITWIVSLDKEFNVQDFPLLIGLFVWILAKTFKSKRNLN